MRNSKSLTPVNGIEKQVLATPISTGGPDRQSMPTGEFPDAKVREGNQKNDTPDIKNLNRKISFGPDSPKLTEVINPSKFRVIRGIPIVQTTTIDDAYKIIKKLADQSMKNDDYKQITNLTLFIDDAKRIYSELLHGAEFKKDKDYHALKIKAKYRDELVEKNNPEITKQSHDKLVKESQEGKKALDEKTIQLKISNNPHLKHLDGAIRKAQIMSYVGGNGNKSQEESKRLFDKLKENSRILPTVKIPSHSDKLWYINNSYKEMAQILEMPNDRTKDINLLRKSLMEMEIIQKFGRAMMDNPERVAEFNAGVEKFNEENLANSSAKNFSQQIQQLNNSEELESLKARVSELEQANEILQNQNRGFEELLIQERLKVLQVKEETHLTFERDLADQKAKLLKDFDRQTESMREEIINKTKQVNALHVELTQLQLQEPEFEEILQQSSSPEISPRIFSEALVNKVDVETQTHLSEKLLSVEMGVNTDEDNSDSALEEKAQTDFPDIAANKIVENVIPNKIMADANTQTTPHQLSAEELNDRLRFVLGNNKVVENKFRHGLWKVVEHNKTLSVNDSNSFEEFWKDGNQLSRPERIAITKVALNRDAEARNTEDIKQVFTVINQFIGIMGPKQMTEYLKDFRDENGVLRNQAKTSMPIAIITDKKGSNSTVNPTSYLENPIGAPLKAVLLQR